MPSIRTENLEMAYQLTALFTSALSPPFVNAGVRFLAPLPGKGGIVDIPFGSAAVVGGRIVGVKGGVRAKPFRQVWIGQELAPEGDQIGLPLLEPALRSVVVETASDEERAAVSFAHQLEHPQRARIGFDPLLDCADDGWVDDVQIGKRAPIEFFGDAAEGRLWVVVAHVVEGAERRQSYADAILTPNIAHRLDHINEQPHPILDRTAISVGAPIGARINELVDQITVGGGDLHGVESGLQSL